MNVAIKKVKKKKQRFFHKKLGVPDQIVHSDSYVKQIHHLCEIIILDK